LPELPEVENVRLGLDKLTSGQIIRGGSVLLPRTLAYPYSVSEFLNAMEGVEIVNWQRRGKYLLATLSRGWLGVHLRMTGQLLWLKQDAPVQKHTRIRLFFDHNQELRFVDTRTFGKFWWIPPTQTPENIITTLQKLGAEPFSAEFTPTYLGAKLAVTNRSIKTLLLDQTVVAGIGNIYADEALFLSGIKPTAIASQLTPKQVEKLHQGIISVLQTAIAEGGTTFSDFLNVTGTNGNYGGMAWVYGRKGKPCRQCNTLIEQIKIVGRSSHFCVNCQK